MANLQFKNLQFPPPAKPQSKVDLQMYDWDASLTLNIRINTTGNLTSTTSNPLFMHSL